MLTELFNKTKLFSLLFKIDQDLCENHRIKGCPHCGAPLHQAHYFRKPRGELVTLPEEYFLRFSLCCSDENCRRRAMPPSSRFWQRRVYWGVIFVMITALRQRKVNRPSARKLKKLFHISHSTLLRWTTYFHDVFPHTHNWKRFRGRVPPGVDEDRIPLTLLQLFFDPIRPTVEQLSRCMNLLVSVM